MTGPDVFRQRAGSNAIGSFIIGVSPIGDIPPFDYWSTVISQYANSPVITQLVANFSAYVDQTINLENFYDLVFNVDTAQGYGLDVWGKIVGVSRTLHIVGSQKYFGFDEATPISADPFGQSPLFSGAQLTSNFDLSDAAYRTLIFAKALSNISDGSIPSINQILLNLFPHRGNCYVTDGLDMTMTYTFAFVLTPVELAIVSQSGVLPKPTGVSSTIVQLI
jgi:hypothetical protein